MHVYRRLVVAVRVSPGTVTPLFTTVCQSNAVCANAADAKAMLNTTTTIETLASFSLRVEFTVRFLPKINHARGEFEPRKAS
jgi:hypothetical protein